jgi:hypothetical protein
MNSISDEQLQELVKLAPFAQTELPIATQASNRQLKAAVIRAREKYRRLSFEFAGDLAREILELRARAKESVSAETVDEEKGKE